MPEELRAWSLPLAGVSPPQVSSRRAMIKVALDLSSEVPPLTGTGLYAIELLNALAALGESEGLRLTAFAPTELHPALPAEIELRAAPTGSAATRRIFQQQGLPWRLRGFDLVHALNNVGPLATPAPRVLTVHDTKLYQAARGSRGPRAPLYRRWLHQAAPRRSAAVIVPSRYSASCVKELGVPPERVHVVQHGVSPPGVSPRQAEEQLERLGLIKDRFVLGVGIQEPAKNHHALLRAYGSLKAARGDDLPPLVLAGRPGWGRSLPEAEVVRLLGYVEREVLASLLVGARCLAFPSLVEGFGFPILEAFAAGTPVMTSSTTACREVAGEGALLVDPSADAAIRAALARLIDDGALRERLRRAGRERVTHFSWERCARETLSVYRQVLRERAR